MGMGQAAGAVAVIANKRNSTPLNVPINEVKKMIADFGGIVP
jgi:hypothetical protein